MKSRGGGPRFRVFYAANRSLPDYTTAVFQCRVTGLTLAARCPILSRRCERAGGLSFLAVNPSPNL